MSMSMPNQRSANSLRGRAIGTMFFAFFGGFWFFIALYARQQLNVASISTVLLGMLVLGLAAYKLMRLSDQFPRVPEDPTIGRKFGLINLIQWGSIAVLVPTLGKLHLDVYVPTAITLIVGLHMLPLARLFRYPQHNITGCALIVWAGAAMLIAPADSMQSTTCIGTGSILWLSGAVTLIRAYRGAHQPKYSAFETVS
jgi:hypothetical protein